MSSPLFQMLGGQNNQITQMIQQFQQFKNSFNGNPKEIVMNMLSQGKITQQQLDQAQVMANQLKDLIR